MIILDGKKVRDERKEMLLHYVQQATKPVALSIIQVGENPASRAYISQKKIFGHSVGVEVKHTQLPQEVTFGELKGVIEEENKDEDVSGIIVQLPLSEHLNKQEVIDCIIPEKDVDGLTTENARKLEEGNARFVPATARGIQTLLEAYDIDVAEKKVVVIGRSALVGRPVAQLMKASRAEVMVCHRDTENIPEKTKKADVLIVATGHPHLVTEEYVKEGQVVVDVGINTVSGESLDEEIPGKKYIGDVDFQKVSHIVKAISPVPGGVGPMTVLSLFENLIDAHKARLV